jgi:hypothetical protein
MSVHFILFAPLALLLPAAGGGDPRSDLAAQALPVPGAEATVERVRYADPPETAPIDTDLTDGEPFRLIAEAFRSGAANQVRIEQQITIRVTPRSSSARRNMLMDMPGRAIAPRFVERKMGKCVDVSDIAGVQPDGGNRLLLFMRDQRIIGAQLDRSCRARDFYSGFYLSRSRDGRLCIDRDTLLSRSGASCTLSKMSRLVEDGD